MKHISDLESKMLTGHPLALAKSLYYTATGVYNQEYGGMTLQAIVTELNLRIETAARGGQTSATLTLPYFEESMQLLRLLEQLYPGYGVGVNPHEATQIPLGNGGFQIVDLDIKIYWM